MTGKFVEQTVTNRLVLDDKHRKIHVILEIFGRVSPSGQHRGNKSAFSGTKKVGTT